MWAIKDVGTILWDFGTFATEEEALDKIDSLSYFGELLEAVEINTDYVKR
jgi:hypothetical protein